MNESILITRYAAHRRQRGLEDVGPGRILRCFMQWLARRRLPVDQITPAILDRYLRWRRVIGLNPKDHYVVVRPFCRWLLEEGILPKDPTEGILCSWIGVPGNFWAYRGILHEVYRHPHAILKYCLLPFRKDLEQYLTDHRQQGYSLRQCQAILKHIFEFYRCVCRRRVPRLLAITPKDLDAYCRLKRRQSSARYAGNCRNNVEKFLSFLFRRRRRSFRPDAPSLYVAALPKRLVQGYLDFCRIHKAHKPSTTQGDRQELIRLGQFLDALGRRHIREVTLEDLDAYLIERGKTHRRQFRPVHILRSFLRYLYLKGAHPTDWSRHVYPPCRFEADTRPKYLPWRTIEQLLDSIDRDTATGKRNYAVVALIACHGLRPREAGSLTIDDIDWENDSFLLRERKNGDTTTMPLAPRAKEALQDYLAVRPKHPAREVFLTVRAPFKPLGRCTFAVARNMIYRHLGRQLPVQGAYLLRHSFAKAMLDRGATLPEIGTFLGHKSLKGTRAYMRIATEDLREVADNYSSLLVQRDPPTCVTS